MAKYPTNTLTSEDSQVSLGLLFLKFLFGVKFIEAVAEILFIADICQKSLRKLQQ
jgi:hypothetical protein